MSVTTAQQINADKLQAALPAGAAFATSGAPLEDAAATVITALGTDDTALQAAITTAAGQFTDRAANLATLQAKAQQALNTNANFQAIGSPNNAQTLAQVQALTKQCNGIIRLLINALDSTSGT